jgi:L-asparaginase II
MNPILIEVTRSDGVESVHRGAAAVVDATGRLIAGWGDTQLPIFPRSAVKPLQALSLIESGAAAHFGLADEAIALACASHNGEAQHAAGVDRWLRHLGLSADALECGRQMPFSEKASLALAEARQPATALHNNCSGKHMGFLATALHHGEQLGGYIAADHPVQRRVAETLAEMSDYDVMRSPWGIDGCGIPVRALPLSALARAMARLARPDQGAPTRAAASRRIFMAMAANAWLVAGTGRFDTLAMEAGAGRFIVKMGAEGVHVAAIPGAGLGIAVKIDDGTRRAAEVAMAALLKAYAGCPLDDTPLAAFLPAPVMNNRNECVGRIRPAAAWLDTFDIAKERST